MTITKNKLRIGLIFGGEAVEHEVSIISARQAYAALDKEKYAVVPIYIAKDSNFYAGDKLLDASKCPTIQKIIEEGTKSHLIKKEKYATLIDYQNFGIIDVFDLALVVTHGTTVEDGVLQGLLTMLKIPYTGCSVNAAAVGQDKVYMKNILQSNNLAVTNFTWFYAPDYTQNTEQKINEIEQNLNYPLIIKPASLGSSIGIKKAENRKQLVEAIEEAIEFDYKILVEEVVQDMKEVNCSVLGDFEECKTSVIEEVIAQDDILSYEDKYQRGNKSSKDSNSDQPNEGMASVDRIIPANISADLKNKISEISKKVFKVLGTNGVARIDYLIDQKSNQVYVNEINTIPGSLSFYLWDKVGVNFTQLLDELIILSIKKERQKQTLSFSFDSDILSMQSKGKS
jgi:D-alanine-D-alanine ligase